LPPASDELPPASAGGCGWVWRLEPKYKKAALIQIALAEALRNLHLSFSAEAFLVVICHLRLKTEAIHKTNTEAIHKTNTKAIHKRKPEAIHQRKTEAIHEEKKAASFETAPLPKNY
jgi:hypothetical protein